jgi:hypothetical protein
MFSIPNVNISIIPYRPKQQLLVNILLFFGRSTPIPWSSSVKCQSYIATLIKFRSFVTYLSDDTKYFDESCFSLQQVIINDEDRKLSMLKKIIGKAAYNDMMTALIEKNENNPSI